MKYLGSESVEEKGRKGKGKGNRWKGGNKMEWKETMDEGIGRGKIRQKRMWKNK